MAKYVLITRTLKDLSKNERDRFPYYLHDSYPVSVEETDQEQPGVIPHAEYLGYKKANNLVYEFYRNKKKPWWVRLREAI